MWKDALIFDDGLAPGSPGTTLPESGRGDDDETAKAASSRRTPN
jgi:hypothetical protein